MKKVLLIAMLCFLAVSLWGCRAAGGADSSVASYGLGVTGEGYVRQMLEALDQRDVDAAFKLLPAGLQDKGDFYAGFQQMAEIWGAKETYQLKKISEREAAAQEQVKTASAVTYRVKKDSRVFSVNLMVGELTGGKKGLLYFNITQLNVPVGNLDTWRYFNFFQWLLLFCAAAEVIFTIYTAIDCGKTRPRWWGLWIALIFILYAGVSFAYGEGLKLGVFFRTCYPIRLLTYPSGEVELILSMPAGALLYWGYKKKLLFKARIEKIGGAGIDSSTVRQDGQQQAQDQQDEQAQDQQDGQQQDQQDGQQQDQQDGQQQDQQDDQPRVQLGGRQGEPQDQQDGQPRVQLGGRQVEQQDQQDGQPRVQLGGRQVEQQDQQDEQPRG